MQHQNDKTTAPGTGQNQREDGSMNDQASEFAKFLVEEYRDIPEQDRVSIIRARFPTIDENAFMRAFAIAEEIAVADAMSVVA